MGIKDEIEEVIVLLVKARQFRDVKVKNDLLGESINSLLSIKKRVRD